MKYIETAGQGIACSRCNTLVAAALLICPGCGALTRSAELNALAAEATAARENNDPIREIASWRSALELLPGESQQHAQVLSRVQDLSKLLDSGKVDAAVTTVPSPVPPPPPPTGPSPEIEAKDGGSPSSVGNAGKSAIVGVLTVIGAILLKSKGLVVLLLTKGKLLLAGLSKSSTFFSMFLSFGLYWSLWGWKFAAGLVVGIYIHEMGHVAALRRLGIKASAPMFIPGLGALVRMKQYPADAREDARIGLAGPIWGTGASLAALVVFAATGSPLWAAITKINAWINLFNLIPIAPLDGGRGTRALLRWQRWVIAGAFWLGYALTHDGLLVLLGIVAVVMALRNPEPGAGDKRAFIEYLVLILVLSGLVMLKVPMVP